LAETRDANKLNGIEACRGVAATVVVLYHAARHLDHAYGVPSLMSVFQFGHAGVDLFFVISGFIILYVHYEDVGCPERLGRYVRRRVTRILPTYWVALALTIILGLAGHQPLPQVFQVILSAILLPSHNEPLLGVAWTLQYEIVFYAVFCLLVFSRRAGLVVLPLWLAWIMLANVTGDDGGGIPPSLYKMYNIEFYFGMGVAYSLRKYTVPSPRIALFTGIALFGMAALAENVKFIDGYAAISRIIYGFPSALIILGAAESDRQKLITVPKVLKILGAASYSIYLFQFIFIGITWKIWLFTGLDKNLPSFASFPLLATAGVAGGVAMSRMVEYPLMGFVRNLRERRC